MAKVAWSRDGKTVYGGGDSGVGANRMIFAWGEHGLGTRAVAADGFEDAIGTIVPLPDGKMVAMSLGGHLTVLDAANVRVAERQESAADFNTSVDGTGQSARFYLDRTGRRVVWSFSGTEQTWHGFNPATLDGTTSSAMPNDLADWSDHGELLQVTDWEDGSEPKLNSRRLDLIQHEVSYAVAVAEDRVLLGTDWGLHQFGPDGHLLWRRRLPDAVWRVNQSADGRLAVAALGDGTIRWYRLRDGQELLAVFFTRDASRWVAFTPSGYYAASPGEENLFGWQVNRGPAQAADFFSASRFHDRFYRPDVVRRVLDTQDEADAVRQAAAPISPDVGTAVTTLRGSDGFGAMPADRAQVVGAEAPKHSEVGAHAPAGRKITVALVPNFAIRAPPGGIGSGTVDAFSFWAT